MALSAAEIKYQRVQTRAFIASNPTSIALIPRVRQMDGRGVRWVSQTARDPQTFKIIDQSSTGGGVPGVLVAADGKQRLIAYQLLGDADAIVGLYDCWEMNGEWWEVAELLPANGYEIRAQVVARDA